MSLTKKQEEGLKIARQRYNLKERYTTIAGLAGSGKTYLSHMLLDALGIKEGEYLVGAYTGKAALRLQENGFPQAKTLHKLFYKSVKIPGSDEFIHIPLEKSLFSQFKLIIIDEVSMVPDSMLRVIANTGLHVINIGDPEQLPPIGTDNGMLASPHIFLDEVVRQAEGNSIVRLAHAIRNREPIEPFCDGNVQMFPKEELSTGMLLWADQILCGKNATRHELNRIVREELGHTGNMPVVGDKIILTRNNWEFVNADGNPIINGLIGNITKVSEPIRDPRGNIINQASVYGYMNFVPDFNTAEFKNVKFDALPFLTGETSYVFDQNAKGAEKINTVDFGFAITTHKSQGSEYSKVLGVEERLNRKNHRKWLYTMVTRASEKLVLAYDKNSEIWEK